MEEYTEYIELLEKKKEIIAKLDLLKEEINKGMKPGETKKVFNYSFTMTKSSFARTLNQKRLKEEKPEVYDDFVEEKEKKPYLKVTLAQKDKGE